MPRNDPFGPQSRHDLGKARGPFGLVRFYGSTRFVVGSGGETMLRLTNDPVASGGTFALSFNGGSSKLINSPGRIVQLTDNRLRFLADGAYMPRVWREGDQLVIAFGERGRDA